LGIEIGNIQKLRDEPGTEFDVHVNEAKELVHGTLRTVRDMAMGLRPSMLDDSGLVPALRWQIRQYSKRTGVSVELETEGVFEDLGESIGTCVYRVVQEALTNCARHANARHMPCVGMTCTVGEGFLDNPIDAGTNGLPEVFKDSFGFQFDGDTRTFGILPDLPSQRRNQTGIIEHGRAESHRHIPHCSQGPVNQFLGFVDVNVEFCPRLIPQLLNIPDFDAK